MEHLLALLPDYLTGHLQLTLIALAAAISISVPLGIVASRIPRLEGLVLGVAGVIQTIPSLALLATMVPLLAMLNLPSIGFLPAIIGLTLYGLLPILRNTVTGLHEVPAELTEAARGVGMTPGQQLRRVELPLAMPVIIGGIRTATVWTVGIATLSTPVGATSLGNYIFGGLQTRNFASVLLGSVAAAGLALLLDGLVATLERGMRDRRRGLLAGAFTIIAALYLFAGTTLILPLFRDGPRPIVVAAKPFTEQYILGDILADQITDETGLPTERLSSIGSMVAYEALLDGSVDTYVDYSGTLWLALLQRKDSPANRQEALDAIEVWLGENTNIAYIGPLGFQNNYALAMRRSEAERLGVTTISELLPYASELKLGGDLEFFSRAEWPALQKTYGIGFAQTRPMDPSLMYQAVAYGGVDVITAYTTDGRIGALDLVVLQDDRRAIPPYDAILLASGRLARAQPEVMAALASLVGSITETEMRAMNHEVDANGLQPAAVAAEFLQRLRAREK
ncbi:MAG: ABC transporter permease/substrate-binding protein [Deltaproteobacteria bacterium]